ncbi:hypothetical protein J6590_099284 [Homalodisca vitripennis]|nr:hypothetical protein J6590_090730 [Homalodisca vitripennis]KAG8308866.1 hypothetical protein J6590_099284 [Homalodisca vitripennis]
MLEVRNDIREVNISRSGIGDDRVDVTYTSGGAIKSSVSRDYCSPHLFADDCQLHMPYGQDMLGKAIGQINSDLLSVSLWSVTNDHNLNTVKCTVLHVAPHTTVQILGEKNRQIRVYGSILEGHSSLLKKLEMLTSYCFPKLYELENMHLLYFQQDGASSHFSALVTDALNERSMYKPASSPDLTPCDFFHATSTT